MFRKPFEPFEAGLWRLSPPPPFCRSRKSSSAKCKWAQTPKGQISKSRMRWVCRQQALHTWYFGGLRKDRKSSRHTYNFRLKKHPSCTAQGTLLNAMWQPGGEGSLGDSGYMYTPPETVTVLLIGYTPIQNKKVKKINKGALDRQKTDFVRKKIYSEMRDCFVLFCL